MTINLKSCLDKSITFIKYAELLGENSALHDRHYKNFQIPTNDIAKISTLPAVQILVITEPWCGDSLALLPIVKKISEQNKNWKLNILLRDQNTELMDKFLTKGSRAIPIFLFLDNKGDYIFHWGPRPVRAQNIFEQHRVQLQNGEIEKSEIILKIRKYYAKDKGKETSFELLNHIYLNM